MYKVAIIGTSTCVLPFKALGLIAHSVETDEEALAALEALIASKENVAIVYLQEDFSQSAPMREKLTRLNDDVEHSIILIPGDSGTLGIGNRNLQEAIEKALGGSMA